MMTAKNVQDRFWEKYIHTPVFILNKSHFRPNNDKAPYELWHGRAAIVKHFIIFGSKCYIKRNDKKLGKFNARADERIFLGYSHNNKG